MFFQFSIITGERKKIVFEAIFYFVDCCKEGGRERERKELALKAVWNGNANFWELLIFVGALHHIANAFSPQIKISSSSRVLFLNEYNWTVERCLSSISSGSKNYLCEREIEQITNKIWNSNLKFFAAFGKSLNVVEWIRA